MFLFRFPKDFVSEQGFVPCFLRDSFVGGLGAVMIVDYTESDARNRLISSSRRFEVAAEKR